MSRMDGKKTHTNTHTRWAFLFSFFSFSVRKIPFAGIELTSQRVKGYMVPLSYRGDRQCVCVCFLPIHSGHQVRWTYQPGSHRRKVTQFLIHLLSAVRALIFLARRIQPSLSLVDREVEFCVLTIQSFSTRWASFLVRKIPFAGIELRPNVSVPSELPGRPACELLIVSSGSFLARRYLLTYPQYPSGLVGSLHTC